MGAPEDVIASLEAANQEGDFLVWDVNWPAVLAFLTVSSQWRMLTQGMSGRIYWQGLDYAAAKVGLDAAGIVITPQLWADLQTMEAAARKVLNGERIGEE